MKAICFILFIILLSVNSIFGQSFQGLPFKQYYNAQEYHGGIQNRSIIQNKKGVLYVANNFGLLEFDGNEWRRYSLPKETKVRDVTINKNGYIYIASQGDFGFFKPTRINTLEYVSLADSLSLEYRNFDETWKVFTKEDQVIFCTFGGLFIFKNNRLTKVITPEYESVNFFFVNHKLYLNSVESGLSTLSDNEIVPFTKGDFFKGKFITGILSLPNNHLWITTLNNGIIIFDGINYTPWNIPVNQELIDAQINNCLRLSNGDIAIGTQNAGAFVITSSGELLLHMNKNEGLANRTVLSMHEDLLGNLWLGHNNGITQLELNLPFSTINEFNGLPGTGYDGVLFRNKIYLGTNNGLYVKNEGNNSEEFKLVPGTEGQVYSIRSIDNELFMGHHEGAFKIEGNTATRISEELGAWTFIKLKDHPEYIIGGTYKGLQLFKNINGEIKFVRKIKGLSESSRIMEQDENGIIWMTHGYKGAYKIELNESLDSLKYTFYNSESGFPSNILINVWKIDGRLVFSSERQVFIYDEETDRFVTDPFFKEHFGLNAGISYLEEDLLGNIYYLSDNDIGVLERQSDGSYIKNNLIFNRLKLQLNDDLQKLRVLNTKSVLYAAKEGFILYSKDKLYNSKVKFNTLIRQVAITNGLDSIITNGIYESKGSVFYDQPNTSIPHLSYDFNSLRIEFSTPFIHTSNTMHYQYRLRGVEENWSDWTSKTDKEYTNIREGSYTFDVRAKNGYDVISNTASYSFKVKPPWFRSPLAYFTYFAFVIAVLGTTYGILDRRHKREKRLITLSKEKELNQKESALRSSEQEIQQLKNEKLKAEVDLKNKELASSTMHLLTKNSFINSMKHNISTIIKRSKNQEVKKELSKIMTNIDKNIAADDEWQQFSIHFDQVHGDFTKRIKTNFPDLTPQEMKLGAYLRMNLSTKEIAHLLNISVRGVEIARYRLRKKLDLERRENLQEFILKY